MKRMFLQAMSAPAFVLLVAVALAVQSTLFNSALLSPFQPDVVLIAVIWCALRRSFTEGGILTLIFAAIAESHSAAPRGFFLNCYMAIYLGLRLFSRYFVISDFTSLVWVTMGAAVAWKLVHLVLVITMNLFWHQWKHTLIYLIPSSVSAGVLALVAYPFLDRFDRSMFKLDRTHRLIEDEIIMDEGK